MSKYRKKPVEIEARQWDGTASGATPLINWMLDNDTAARYYAPGEYSHIVAETYIAIDTLEGQIVASPGDFIIQGIQGEFYPCKPDIFAATYEAVSA